MSLLAPKNPILVTASAPRSSHRHPHPPNNTVLPFQSFPSPPKPKPRILPAARCTPRPPPLESQNPSPSPFRLLPFVVISAVFLCHRAFLRLLPPDFLDRWHRLLAFSDGAESKVTQLPYHFIQAIMASEDRRFFYHFGVDPYGVGRAVVYYPNGGGGSTITQQLVKNVFLTNERKISRKFVEGILSLILERRMSKWEILYSYLNKMYWGHGKFGIEAASHFYFGKHHSLLNLGESALLAGILPAPEALNPITNPKRGKSSQARVLRRMVAAGFLDLETALMIVSQPLCLRIHGPEHASEECGHCKSEIRERSAIIEIWDWEMANILWEAREDMEKWAKRKHKSHRYYSLLEHRHQGLLG